jgi:hypothetical protein
VRINWNRHTALGLLVLFAVVICLVDVNGQQRRRRRARRKTSAAAVASSQPSASPTPSAADATVISTNADSSGNQDTRAAGPQKADRTPGGNPPDPDSIRHTVDQLSNQVNRLTEKLGQMQEQQRTLVDLERLSRAEVRAENLRTQLRDVQAKQGDLEARAEQIDYDLQPENIEHALAAFGTLHPEQLREQRRRQLESEKRRVQEQLATLQSSRPLSLPIPRSNACERWLIPATRWRQRARRPPAARTMEDNRPPLTAPFQQQVLPRHPRRCRPGTVADLRQALQLDFESLALLPSLREM